MTTYPEGTAIVREGVRDSAFFVILEGRARVVSGGRTLSRLGRGDFFGEISILDGGPRTASVIAEEPTRCLNLAGRDFHDLLGREPQLAVKVLKVVAQRLREHPNPLVE